MSNINRYAIAQGILFVAFVLYVSLAKWEFLQYGVIYFALSIFLYINETVKKTLKLSRYLKDTYKEIYEQNTGFRKYWRKDLWTVNVFSLREAEINTIADSKFVQIIYRLRLAQKIFFISTSISITLLILSSYKII